MSAGLERNENLPYTDPRNDEIVMTMSRDPIRYVLSRPIVGALGARPGPTTVASHSSSERSCSARPVSRPGSTSARSSSSRSGSTTWSGLATSTACRLRPRDLAKFGSLYLHDGRWRGRQINPPDWVRESTRRHLPLRSPVSAFGTHGYGYQWRHNGYRTGSGTFEALTATGNGQQRIYVLPALRLVVTVLAGRYNDPSAARLTERLLLEQIIPAVCMASNTRSTPEPTSCRASSLHAGR